MSPTDRLELIRARLKQPVSSVPKPAGQFCAATGSPPLKRKKAYVRGPEKPCYSYSVYGQVIASSVNRKEWVQKEDKKQRELTSLFGSTYRCNSSTFSLSHECAKRANRFTHASPRVRRSWNSSMDLNRG